MPSLYSDSMPTACTVSSSDTCPERTLLSAPVDLPKPKITFTKSGGNATISYLWDAGFFRLQHKTTSLAVAGGWTDVSPQPARQLQGTEQDPVAFYFTVPLGTGTEYFRLTRRQYA